ncbi:chloride channel protein [Arachidicoccus ginsenosidimutans]|uniref:chloride channel protein n=1 Tax=Arachidicoccus sp. BS20 TaxID=1850526 RepID=UPI000A70DC68|nr:chloride channel protein [Arachidicoccus sp. BS20]
MRKKIIRTHYWKLVAFSFLTGLIATLLAYSLKIITGYFEDEIFAKAAKHPVLYIFLPTIGITAIYFSRKIFFKNKQNKGIKEIYQTIDERKNELPFFKIPSHYINGLLTVMFGGSTGVEVSTVVATATVGSVTRKKAKVSKQFKIEMICAGVAAGIATLFASPLAGLLFSIEVIARKFYKTVLISCLCAVSVSWLFIHFVAHETLFDFSVYDWKIQALPFMIVLSVLSGLLAVYFTKSVIFIKEKFGNIQNNFLRVNIGALIVGLSILMFPQLFGDSYRAIPQLLSQVHQQGYSLIFTLILLAIIFLKPIVASLTLGAGGDGGVFAPSIVAGAVLGMLVAVVCNQYFHTHLIVLNFALIGAAAMLSAAIHAPFTALFLVCGLVPNGFILFIPVMLGSFVAKYTAKTFFAYTVYSYKGKKSLNVVAAINDNH